MTNVAVDDLCMLNSYFVVPLIIGHKHARAWGYIHNGGLNTSAVMYHCLKSVVIVRDFHVL